MTPSIPPHIQYDAQHPPELGILDVRGGRGPQTRAAPVYAVYPSMPYVQVYGIYMHTYRYKACIRIYARYTMHPGVRPTPCACASMWVPGNAPTCPHTPGAHTHQAPTHTRRVPGLCMGLYVPCIRRLYMPYMYRRCVWASVYTDPVRGAAYALCTRSACVPRRGTSIATSACVPAQLEVPAPVSQQCQHRRGTSIATTRSATALRLVPCCGGGADNASRREGGEGGVGGEERERG
jgi:hypothetical protein